MNRFLGHLTILQLLVSTASSIDPPPACATTINFDEPPTAAGFFGEATALTNEYEDLGVTFSGPDTNDGTTDGGAVLDIYFFTINDESQRNALVFSKNDGEVFPDGGQPKDPETLSFASEIGYVQMNVAAGAATAEVVATFECFNGSGGPPLVSTTITVGNTMET